MIWRTSASVIRCCARNTWYCWSLNLPLRPLVCGICAISASISRFDRWMPYLSAKARSERWSIRALSNVSKSPAIVA